MAATRPRQRVARVAWMRCDRKRCAERVGCHTAPALAQRKACSVPIISTQGQHGGLSDAVSALFFGSGPLQPFGKRSSALVPSPNCDLRVVLRLQQKDLSSQTDTFGKLALPREEVGCLVRLSDFRSRTREASHSSPLPRGGWGVSVCPDHRRDSRLQPKTRSRWVTFPGVNPGASWSSST